MLKVVGTENGKIKDEKVILTDEGNKPDKAMKYGSFWHFLHIVKRTIK